MNKLTIAIDPSFANTGICYKINNKYYFKSFKVQSPKSGKKGQKLKTFKNDISIFQFQLRKLIIDELFLENNTNQDYEIEIIYNEMFSKNIQTVKNLYKLIGVIELVAIEFKAKVKVYNEAKVRKELTGYGGSNREKAKNLSIEYAKSQGYNLTEDEADAFMLMKYHEFYHD